MFFLGGLCREKIGSVPNHLLVLNQYLTTNAHIACTLLDIDTEKTEKNLTNSFVEEIENFGQL